jgi:catechol 2,3-dioxygenase-like lactoylglutathione lyase family enzyme
MTEWCKLVPEVTVSDFAQSLAFYTETLGFQVLFSRTQPNFAYLEFEGAQLMLEEYHPDGWNVGELAQPYGRGVNFQIECMDVAALLDRLAQAGYPIYRGAQDTWYDVGDGLVGSREFLVQDPDGYLLRFAQDLGKRSQEA